MVQLSLLDRSRTRAGEPDGAALSHTVERAVRAEALGFHRFWVAEHHAVPGIASGAPAVLLAAIGTRTRTIRIGSGGVMLPNHQPFVVAEQFLVLEALFPGRVDLGVGRSLGFTPPVRRALRSPASAPDSFASDLAALGSYLDGTAEVTARPAVPGGVPRFVLATGAGLEVAASLGLPVVVGGPVLESPDLPDLLARYRSGFRGDGRPTVLVSADVLVADTDDEARRLALPEAWAWATSRRTGSFPALEPVEAVQAAAAAQVPPRVRADVEASRSRVVAGSPASVRRRLEALVDRTGAAELLVFSSTFDRDALAASDEALAGLFPASARSLDRPGTAA
ncbi:MsnO8 family LLM class oxidoreductase [Nocardioides litoris]|uniref:MsnO8 family LLM class oxidoreductase n=1 Tax=Nocardioides litoris TaxID=1926648 RepID=UPI001B875F77|nr:MsnO8 family LLM class oxidoreductase [Nocardioides litoris]